MKEEAMGYQNYMLAEEMAEQGRVMKPHAGNAIFDPMAYTLLTHMAIHTYDLNADNKRQHRPIRLYEQGWESVAAALGMWLAGGEEKALLLTDEAARINAKNMQLAVKRISKAAKMLESQGLTKCLRKADLANRRPAKWLLLLGDDEENEQVEAYDRALLAKRRDEYKVPWRRY